MPFPVLTGVTGLACLACLGAPSGAIQTAHFQKKTLPLETRTNNPINKADLKAFKNDYAKVKILCVS